MQVEPTGMWGDRRAACHTAGARAPKRYFHATAVQRGHAWRGVVLRFHNGKIPPLCAAHGEILVNAADF